MIGGDHDALTAAFGRSFSKLLKKGVPLLDLAEFVLRARFIRASRKFCDGLPPAGKLILAGENAWVLGVAANDPAAFDLALIVGEESLRKHPQRDGDLTGLPSYTLRRLARSKRPLTDDQARTLDGSPFGSTLLRLAKAEGLPITSLREVNPAALPRMADAVGQREVERGAEQYLVELVHHVTGRWYFEDVANLLHCDAKPLEKRSQDFRKRRADGPRLLSFGRPS